MTIQAIQTLGTGIMALLAGWGSGTYHRDQLELDRAWGLTQGRPEVTVAIISTGANFYVPEIRSGIALNPAESGEGRETDSLDNDENGYIDDVYGVDTLKGFTDPMDRSGLGSFEATLIASTNHGIAPRAKVIPIAACDQSGTCTVESIIKAIAYARGRSASVIMLSAGGALDEAAQAGCEAIRDAQIPVIGAAAGEALDLSRPDRQEKVFPADCEAPNLVIATSVNARRELAPFSNYGAPLVHVAAPGVEIPGLNHHGIAVRYTGTNVAAAATAAVAALVKSYHPDYTTAQIKQALIQGADPVPALQGKVMSGGTLNAYKALIGTR